MKKVWFVALLCLTVLPFHVRGFWSLVSIGVLQLDDHADITNAAIGPTKSFQYNANTGTYTFTPQAIRAITKANDDLDAESINPYNAADHFDNQAFVAGVKLIATRRKNFKTLLTPPVSAANQQLAWKMLGYMFHSIQDFYAHSTWIELGRANSIVNFGVLTENTSSPVLTTLTPASGTVCASAAYPLLTPVEQMTSGYYDPNDPLGSTDSAPSGLCQHGTLLQAASTCAAPFAIFSVSGISKDSSCATYPQAPEGAHIKAWGAALNETTTFVQAVIADLQASGNTAGFCALLGLSANAPICFAGTLSGTLPLQLQGGLTFPGGITLNSVSFGVAIDVNGGVSAVPVPITFDGNTDSANWFLTACPPSQVGGGRSTVCAPYGTFYDWNLTPTTLCVGDGANGCGPVGSAMLNLVYNQPLAGDDEQDNCKITISLTNNSGTISAVAAQGSACNYLGAGLTTLLNSNTAVCFNEPAGMVCP
jgi:hypothetical protein